MIELFPQHSVHIKCTDDETPLTPLRKPKGTGGTATLWPKHLDHCIEAIPDGCGRVNASLIHTTKEPILLINTYMPTEGTRTEDRYANVLDEIHELLQKFPNCIPVWTGDINANNRRLKYSNDRLLMAFIKEENLVTLQPPEDIPTFHHFNGTSKSTIDMFITREEYKERIGDVKVDERNPLNHSSHDAIHTYLKGDLPEKKTKQPSRKALERTKWNSVDKAAYSQETEVQLKCLQDQLSEDTPAEIVVLRLNKILTECCKDSTPPQPKSKSKNSKYKWNNNLRVLMKASKEAFWVWKSKGRPQSASNVDLNTMKAAKKALKRAQRYLTSQERRNRHTRIMTATAEEMPKLIKKQRQHHTQKAVIEFDQHSQETEADSWAHYFEDLSTPKEQNSYNKEHWKHIQMKHGLLSLLTKPADIQEVNIKEVEKHIKDMKSNKAQDIYGISSEHLKFASPEIATILQIVTNKILNSGVLPDCLKAGIVTPILKKGKPAKHPDSYRRITVTSIIGKVIEKEILCRTKALGKEKRSPLQFGFTEGVSPTTAAMLLTEAISHSQDTERTPYVTYMDASKAFDLVCHPGLLNILHSQGIDGNMWMLYNSMYSDIKGNIKWENGISKEITDRQGLRQGGSTSAEVFNRRSDQALCRLQKVPNSLRIGIQEVNALMVADDLALVSCSPTNMQQMIHIAEQDASNERYLFSDSKTKCVKIQKKKQTANDESPNFMLNQKEIEMSDEEKHLGIHRAYTNSPQPTLEARMKSARRAAYSLFGAGFHGLNGVGPDAIRKQFITYIRPVLTYGLDTLILEDGNMQELETFTRSMLRRLQYLPSSTPIPVIYLLFGLPPIEAIIHIQTLTFLGAICRRVDSVEHYVVTRQAGMCSTNEKSWVMYAKNLLRKYDLPSIFELIQHTPSKEQWKRTVKKSVTSQWEDELREEAKGKTSLKLLDTERCSITRTHQAWGMQLTDPVAIQKATIKIRLLIQQYPLTAYSVAGKKKSPLCPMCEEESETTDHFLLRCRQLHQTRLPLLRRILSHLRTHRACISTIVTFILDPPSSDPSTARDLDAITRDLCYRLHQKRKQILTR